MSIISNPHGFFFHSISKFLTEDEFVQLREVNQAYQDGVFRCIKELQLSKVSSIARIIIFKIAKSFIGNQEQRERLFLRMLEPIKESNNLRELFIWLGIFRDRMTSLIDFLDVSIPHKAILTSSLTSQTVPKRFHHLSRKWSSEVLADFRRNHQAYYEQYHVIPRMGEDVDEIERMEAIYYAIVLTSVTYKGHMLKFAKHLQRNRSVVQASVKNNGRAITYAHPDFRKDEEIALDALAQCSLAYYDIDEEFKNDHAFLLKAIKRNSHVFLLREDLVRTEEFVTRMISENPKLIIFMNHFIRDSQTLQRLINIANIKNPKVFEELDFAREDSRYMLCAASIDVELLKYASCDLLDNYQFIKSAMRINPRARIFASRRLFKHPLIRIISCFSRCSCKSRRVHPE